MRYIALSLLIVITCVACSDDDIQIGLEKVDSQEKSTVYIDPNKDIYIEFDNTESDTLSLATKDQMNVQEIIETETAESEAIETEESETEESETETAETIKEKTFEELLEEKMEQLVQETTEVYQETTPIEAINERMREMLEERDEEAFAENLSKAINGTPSLDKQTDEDLIKQLETSLAEIDDAEIMANYGPKGSAIDLNDGNLTLKNYSTPLAILNSDLVSVVAIVPGSTSIKENLDGLGFTVDLSGDYLFDFDQDILTIKGKKALQSIMQLYQQYGGVGIDVAGHTDSKGASNYNLALSRRRAKAVKEWFESEGIGSTLISAVGYGEDQPVAPNMKKNDKDNPDGRSLNRRVNITVKTKNKIKLLQQKN